MYTYIIDNSFPLISYVGTIRTPSEKSKEVNPAITKMGRIQTDQLPGPPPPQAQGGVPPYPPQPHQPPPPQYNLHQPPPPPLPNAAHMMPPSTPPQHQASYSAYQNNAAQYNQVTRYEASWGAPGAPVQAQVASPLQASGNFVQQNNVYNNGGGTQFPQQSSTYPGSSGFQLPKLWPQSKGGYVGTRPWNTGLFDCMQDPSNAFITALFPCVTFGQIADVLDKGNTTCATSGIIYGLSPCMLSRRYRTKLRRMFGLVEAPASDWIVHTIFEPCALCQEYRELNSRGIDPVLGMYQLATSY
ncbi:hypothetical protein CRG98_019146 [Punica granatum]|uniref:Protein PLANT CADMIUM RESISTANCE 4-like n=2 Tax=Punica granatum TaxID=22663 RepID=A0A2I0JW58_PUNGR|nr:hypothetical protein CRG98_019146 [Punica granatum]